MYGGWRPGVLGRAETEVFEDLLDGYLVVEVGNDLELAPAATRERVGMEDLGDQARPTRGTAALLGWLLFNLGLSRLLCGAISALPGQRAGIPWGRLKTPLGSYAAFTRTRRG